MADLTTNAIITFAAPPSAGEDATFLGFFASENGTDFLFAVPITGNPDALALGEFYQVPIGDLDLTQAATSNANIKLGEAGARRMLTGLITGGGWAAVFDGDPGTTGANEIGAIDRVQQAVTIFAVT